MPFRNFVKYKTPPQALGLETTGWSICPDGDERFRSDRCPPSMHPKPNRTPLGASLT
jgi:hypothetical protein